MLLAAAAGVHACALEPLPALGLPCTGDTDCPAGYRCLGGELCAPTDESDGGADPGPDGGTPPLPGSVAPDYLVVTLGTTASTALRIDGDPGVIMVLAERGTATLAGVTLSYTAPATAGRDTIGVSFTNGTTELVVDVVDAATFDQVWTGLGSAVFADPANWEGGAPLGAVLIPAGTPAPVVDADLSVEELVIETGVTVDAEDRTLATSQALRAGGTFTPRSLAYVVGEVAGHFDDLTVAANAALIAPTLVADDLAVAGPTTCILETSGELLEVQGDLTTDVYGHVRMTDPDARVIVRGDASFRGGEGGAGSMTAGILELHGNFAQANGNFGLRPFVASGNHLVRLAGDDMQSVAFQDSAYNVFADVEVAGVGTELATSVVVMGGLEVQSGSSLTARSGTLDVRGEVATQPGALLAADRLVVSHPLAFAEPSSFDVDLLVADDGTEALPPELPYLDLEVVGSVEAEGETTISGALTVSDNSGVLIVREAHIVVSGDFSTAVRGVLRMDDGQGILEVDGLATFAGGNDGDLAAGTLVLHGGLRQQYSNAVGGNPLIATNLHLTRFEGGPQAVSFENPGTSINTSSWLQHVEIADGAEVTFETDAFVIGDLTVLGALHIAGAHVITVTGLTSLDGTVDGGTLQMNGGCEGLNCP